MTNARIIVELLIDKGVVPRAIVRVRGAVCAKAMLESKTATPRTRCVFICPRLQKLDNGFLALAHRDKSFSRQKDRVKWSETRHGTRVTPCTLKKLLGWWCE